MDNLGVVFKLEGVKEALNLFSPVVVSKAIRYALDRSGKGIRTEIVKEISKGYNIKQKDIREKINLGKVVNLGKDNEVTIRIRGSRIPLGEFPLAQAGKGLVALVRKDKPTYYEAGFFHEKIGESRVTRSGKVKTTTKATAYQRKTKKAYPIWTQYGPSIPQLVGSDYMYKVVQRIFSERMQKDFNHGISFYSGMVKAGAHWSPGG